MHSAGRTEVVHKNCSPEGGRQQVGLAGAAEVAVPAHSCSAAVAHSLAAEPGTHPGAESMQQAGNRQLGCRPAGHLHYSCNTKEMTNIWKMRSHCIYVLKDHIKFKQCSPFKIYINAKLFPQKLF